MDQSRTNEHKPPYIKSEYNRYSTERSSTPQSSGPEAIGPQHLLQISGPGRHVEGIPKVVAKLCFESPELKDANGQFRVILGIKANGASEFLVPMQKASFRPRHGMQPYRANHPTFRAFFSLSPIVIPHLKALEETLGQHMCPKKGKPAKANKRYELANSKYSDDMGVNQPRCIYEQCRLFMAGLSLSLFHSLFSYGLTSPRPTSLTFLVLACNAYKLRNIGDFLDVAWGVVDASSVRSQEDLDTLKVDLKQDVDFQNEMFAGGRRRQPCRNGTTLQVGDIEDKRIALKAFIQSHQTGGKGGPLILLTFDWELSKRFLNAIGVNTGSWIDNLDDLFRPKATGNTRQEPRRSRSRSPERKSGVKIQSPTLTGPRRPVDIDSNEIHVLDVRGLYGSARRAGRLETSLLDACKDFDMGEVDSIPPNTFCAGNELSLIWELFMKMAQGPSVDEMWTAQFKDKRISAYSDDEDEDEEEGGGILSSAPLPAQRTGNSASRAVDPFGLWDEDEDRLLDD